MVEERVHEPSNHLAIFGIDRDREADVFLRDQHHGGEGAEDGAAVPDDLLALIIGHGPAERIGVEIGLGGFERLGQLPDRLDDERSPHLAGLRLAVEPPLAFRQLARSEEHTSELQSLMRISYAVFCLKKKTKDTYRSQTHSNEINY